MQGLLSLLFSELIPMSLISCFGPLEAHASQKHVYLLSRQPSVSTTPAKGCGSTSSGSRDPRLKSLTDGSERKPYATSCSGLPKGSPLSPWAVTQCTTYMPLYTHTQTSTHRQLRAHTHSDTHRHRRSYLPAGTWCLTACYICLLCPRPNPIHSHGNVANAHSPAKPFEPFFINYFMIYLFLVFGKKIWTVAAVLSVAPSARKTVGDDGGEWQPESRASEIGNVNSIRSRKEGFLILGPWYS